MAKVILITTREITNVLSVKVQEQVQEETYCRIKSTNYKKVFFSLGTDKVSAISDQLCKEGDSSQLLKYNTDDMPLSANLCDVVDIDHGKIDELFDILLSENNINLLKGKQYGNIEFIRDGIIKIKDKPVYICHEWFSDVFGDDDGNGKATRTQYYQAIVNDIKADIANDNITEWVVIAHDEDFGIRESKNITNSNEVKALGLPEGSVVWTFQHRGDNRIYLQFINNVERSKFDDLLYAPNSVEYLNDLVNGPLVNKSQDVDAEQETGDNIENIESSEQSIYISSATSVSLVDVLNVEELKNGRKIINGNTIVDDAIKVQNAQNNTPKPIIIYWPNMPLKAIDDKRRNYLDSSIWVRYADSEKSLLQLKTELENCSNLHATNNALEIREFKIRMAENSRLIELKTVDNTNTHAQNVVPFVFHSETEMQTNTDDSKNGVKTKILQSPNAEKLEWRILIVDDNAFVDDKTRKTSVNKCQVISSILNRDFLLYCDNHCDSERIKCNPSTNGLKCPFKINCSTTKNKNNFYPLLYIDCARSVDEAKEKIKHRRYDIVLMDYLLGCCCEDSDGSTISLNKIKDTNKHYLDIFNNSYCEDDLVPSSSEDEQANPDPSNSNRSSKKIVISSDGKRYLLCRQYGTDILKELKIQYEDNVAKTDLTTSQKDELEQYKQAKGPFGKFWIFFISAFSNAISEKMLSEGMHYNTDYWHIARGACPTTTPELFRYNLMSLMHHQLKHITEIDEWESVDDQKHNKQKVITLMDYLSYLFDDLGDVRIRAIDNFNSLLHLRSRYDRLKNDYYMGGKELGKIAKENGSPLVQALFSDMDCYSNAFWEHTQHLVYLIAFGNILQWNEMWDEYIFIKENLKSAEKATNKQNEKLHEKIEKYIIGIKSANFK